MRASYWRSRRLERIFREHVVVARMSGFSARLAVAVVLAALCPGGRTAQLVPLTYWTPGWPLGFSGSSSESINTYGDFPSFEASEAGGFFHTRYNFPNGWFVGSERSGIGLNMSGLAQDAAFGNFGELYSEGTQFGYNFKSAGGLPVTVYAGFDTLKYNTGIGGSLFAPFDTQSGTLPGYSAHAGVEVQAAPNLSLSLGFGFSQLSGITDSDINSPLPPGATPFAFGGRR